MYKTLLKRTFDVIISLIGLPLLIIIMLPISIFIKYEDGGPIFYIAKRLGRNGVPFKMFKFRTMKINSPDLRLPDGSTFNSENDQRVTKVGKFLRERSLDETPQIINVLEGNMSLIGPRPEPIDIIERYPEIKSAYSVRPGITGYCQAYYRNEADAKGKIKHDIYYVNNISFRLDAKIFFKTIICIFKREKIYRKEDSTESQKVDGNSC